MSKAGVSVEIVRFVDNHQPGWVECRLIDAWGNKHSFREKFPVVSTTTLDEGRDYPQPGLIGCQIIKEWQDDQARKIVTIDTELPWHIESKTSKTCFDVLPEQLVEI